MVYYSQKRSKPAASVKRFYPLEFVHVGYKQQYLEQNLRNERLFTRDGGAGVYEDY